MIRPSASAVTSLVAAIITVGTVVACSGARSHVYRARGFDAVRQCLQPATAVDVVEGGDPGLACARTCLVGPLPSDGGARPIYVSTACPPYPNGYDASGDGGGEACTAAVAAAEREDYCFEDGGSTKPQPRDAASE